MSASAGTGQAKKAFGRAFDFAKLRNLDMRRKIVIFHCILLIIPLLFLYYFAMKIYVEARESEVLSSSCQVSEIAMSNIDNYVQQIQELTKQPLYDSRVLVALENSNARTDAEAAAAGSSYAPRIIPETDNTITNMANRILLFNKYINSVIVMDVHGNYAYRIIDNSITRPYNALSEPWYAGCLRLDGKAMVVNTFDFMGYVLGDYYTDKKDLFVFSVARVIKETNSNRRVGMIMININADYLADICANVRSLEGERVLIVDGGGNICYDTNTDNIGGSMNGEAFDLTALADLDFGRSFNNATIGGEKYIVSSVSSALSGWKLVRILPERQLYASIWELRNMLTLLLLAFVIVSMLLSISISYSVTKPLNKLMHTIKAINAGDFTRRFNVRYNDEVGQVGRSFNKMMDMIDNLVNTVHVAQLQEREAELHALQAQINPHFIYNTLESIRLEAKASGSVSTSQMVFVLGKLLRYSINIKNKIVTVRDEIEHLNNYLFLLNYRFDNKYAMTIDMEESLYALKVIKLIFQPVVENSIYHGLETQDREGFIRLTGRRLGGRAVFEIEDNGCGMSEETLSKLREKLSDFSRFDQPDGSIGLRNINERVKLQYGADYGISVESEEGRGTKVTIALPAES
jgi:two-component system sensor histidine kinase YesM